MNAKRNCCAVLAVLLLSSAGAASLQAANSLGADPANDGAHSYIVVMANDPAVAYEGGIADLVATKPGRGEKINPKSAHVRKYQQFLKASHDRSLAKAGVSTSARIHNYTIALNGYSAMLTEQQVKAIKAQAGVVKVLEDQMRFLTTDASPEFLGLTVYDGAWDKGYDGEGVVVGVIDSGIWPEHPSFADDGSFAPPPILPLDDGSRPNCEFGNTAHNPIDAPFTCNNKLLGARQMLDTYRALIGADPDEYDSARDDDGHGTHTASTAAGNGGVEASVMGAPRGVISGMAPRAHVIAYKAIGNLGGFTSDLAAAIDQAVADGVDVINYSIGGGAASPNADEIAFLFAADAGVFSATSAGNSGPGAGTLGNPGTMPWLTTVGASTQGRFFMGTVTLGDGSYHQGASIHPGTVTGAPLVDAEFAGGDLCVPGTLDPAKVFEKVVLCRRGVVARTDKSLAVYQAGGVGMVFYNTTNVENLSADTHWVPTVHVDAFSGLAVKAYIADSLAASLEPTASIVGEQLAWWTSAPSMAVFSSRGPNIVTPDIIKPDLTAPGVQVLAGFSPTPDPGTMPGQLFAALDGTSMSSPHVAGVFALLKQAHPDWSAAMAKSALMTTAYQDVVDNDRASPADAFDFGAGHINPGGAWIKGSVAQPGLAYDAGLYEYAAYTCGAGFGVFTPGSCAFLDSLGIPSDPSDLNLPSIGIDELAGIQTVQRTVTSVANESGWRTYYASVDAPPGYDVIVDPATLRLKKDQSATYQVMVINQTAPVGEWRFGSLTWLEKDGNYSVFSPIAVRGSMFWAPEAVSGTGESGAASFDVKFGYSGSYAAASHGLVPATVISDNVLQDPDQSFNPSDGYSNLHQFVLSGTAYFRVALPPEATEAGADLDIFVFDPSDNLAASSTKGGTDELVEITLPADGTWSVYVHGWATPGGDSDYDLYAWAVSATPGGNLVVDSAPTAAAIGTTGTVNLSWTGATDGVWHLGAVSHTGDSGLMGLTLVEVDNR